MPLTKFFPFHLILYSTQCFFNGVVEEDLDDGK